jgi:hypothetical protein
VCAGARDVTVTTDKILMPGSGGALATGVELDGTGAVTGSTVLANCGGSVGVTGSSSATIENNVLNVRRPSAERSWAGPMAPLARPQPASATAR